MSMHGKTWLVLAMTGCVGSAPTNTTPDPHAATGATPAATTPSPMIVPEDPALAARSIDYGLALRTASLKLTGGLPSLAEQRAVTDAKSYAAQIDLYLADPRFAAVIRSYFSDLFKMGGTLTATVGGQSMDVSLDTAPTFAASLVVRDQPLTRLFTATAQTCPRLDVDTGVFTDGDCGGTAVGVLTDPGAMAQYYSNMAFRRVRFIQETFVCTKFPAEYTAAAQPKGAGSYVSPWPFGSVSGGGTTPTAPIDFQDTSAVICANCHSTMNHVAPLFANFDVTGLAQPSVQVHTPVAGSPLTQLGDWLPTGEQLAWRYQRPITSLSDLGAALAADPDTAECQVARAWNWAMSKTDIVGDLAVVPKSVIAPVTKSYVNAGYRLKPALKAIFTSDDFVKF